MWQGTHMLTTTYAWPPSIFNSGTPGEKTYNTKLEPLIILLVEGKQHGMKTWHLTQGWSLRLASSTRRDRIWSFCLRLAAAVREPAMLGAWALFLELGRLHRARWFHLTDSIYLTWNGCPGGHLVVTYSIRNIHFQNRLSAGNTGQLSLFLVLLWQEPQRESELTFLCL